MSTTSTSEAVSDVRREGDAIIAVLESGIEVSVRKSGGSKYAHVDVFGPYVVSKEFEIPIILPAGTIQYELACRSAGKRVSSGRFGFVTYPLDKTFDL